MKDSLCLIHSLSVTHPFDCVCVSLCFRVVLLLSLLSPSSDASIIIKHNKRDQVIDSIADSVSCIESASFTHCNELLSSAVTLLLSPLSTHLSSLCCSHDYSAALSSWSAWLFLLIVISCIHINAYPWISSLMIIVNDQNIHVGPLFMRCNACKIAQGNKDDDNAQLWIWSISMCSLCLWCIYIQYVYVHLLLSCLCVCHLSVLPLSAPLLFSFFEICPSHLHDLKVEWERYSTYTH